MPNRSRKGDVNNPARVVAPTSVNGGKLSLIDRAAGPSPIIMSNWKSSSAGYRISSIEPNLLKNETIELVSKSRTFVPHFHIPLQSGSNEILKKMKRRYLRELYVDRVNKIREVMPQACIGVDVIVGFPGESDELFLET